MFLADVNQKGSKVKGRTPLLSSKELYDIGIKIAIYANEYHRAAIWVVQKCAMHLLDKGTTIGFEDMVDFSTREQIVGTAEWEAQAIKYLANG